MPVNEAIVDSVLPNAVEKPIPTRTVITRSQPKNINQPSKDVATLAADSAPAESVRLSPQLTALARKEQAYRQREQALREKERQLESRLADADKYSQLRQRLEQRDFSAVEELGLSYEDYTKSLLERQESEDPTQKLIAELKSEIEALKKGTEENASREYEETVAEYKREISKLIGETDQFPKIKKAKKEDAVLQLIIDSWEEDDVQLSIEEAAREVEQYMTEEAKTWASLLEDQRAQGDQGSTLPPPRPQVKTITQQMQPSGVEKRPAKSLQHLSDEERYAEARRRVLERRQLGR